MTFWPGPPTCKLQGSLIAREAFTVRVNDADVGDSDLSIAQGDSWPSVDAFLSDWTDQLVADLSGPFSLAVSTATGKIVFTTGTGNDYAITWAQAGDATEAVRWRDWLGATGDISVPGDPTYTFPNAHKAGWYPSLAPTVLTRASTDYRRGQGTSLATSSWTQASPGIDDQGRVAVDIELQIDGSTDWSELWDLAQFFDDVFDYMGEPFTVINVPSGDASGDRWTGFVATQPFEFIGERVEPAFDGLLRVAVRMDAAHAPS